MNYSALVLSACTSEFWKERESEEVRKWLFPKELLGLQGWGAGAGAGAAGSRCLQAASAPLVQ